MSRLRHVTSSSFPFIFFFFLITRLLPRSTLFPYTTLFRSSEQKETKQLTGERTEVGLVERAKESAVALKDRALERSEEHTSELQSHSDLVCRLLLEKKKRRNEWS